jgi:hypothetical protein
MSRLVCLNLLLVLSQAEKEKSVISIGNTATIPCKAKRVTNYQEFITLKFKSDLEKRKTEKTVLQAQIDQNRNVNVHIGQPKFNYDGNRISINNITIEDEGNYTCEVQVLGDPSSGNEISNFVEVRIKPEVKEIEYIPTLLERPLVDYKDAKLPREAREVARCVAVNGKPKPQIKWVFESKALKPEVTEEDTVYTAVKYNRVFTATSTLSIIPEKKYNNQMVSCHVSHVEIGKPIVKQIKLNVEYAPTIPTLRPVKQQRELTCKTDANPEPTFMWVLPDGSQRSGHTIELMQLNNPNATYTCTVQNRWGNEHKTITNREIDAIPDPAPAMASLPVIIGIAFCAILVLVIGGFVFYKYFLNPRQSEKNDPYRPYNPAHSNTDHIITGVPYDTTGSKHRLERQGQDEDSTDDEGGHDQPILSHSAAGYHASRRSTSQMRHSPSRGTAPPVHHQYPDYDDNMDDVYEGDELIDDAATRFADYNPGQTQKPVGRQVYNRDYAYQGQHSYQDTDMSADPTMV